MVKDDSASGSRAPQLWGLSAVELHEAYWSSHGVACVELGSGVTPQAGADLYLLVERGNAVLFDLRAIAESLLWNKADITRLRLVENSSADYGETVRLAADGSVAQIERHYRAQQQLSTQVFLARSADDAAHWSASTTASEAHASMRRHHRVRIDSTACPGRGFTLAPSPSDAEQGFLRCLVEEWPRPDQVLRGVVQLQEGIFALQGTTLSAEDRCVGPLWIGRIAASQARRYAVGPDVIADELSGEPIPVRLIEEIFSPDAAVAATDRTRATGWYQPLKRASDVVLSVLTLALMSPVLLVCAVAIVLDDGFPVFFGHGRQTRGGATFKCWKFRTMRKNAEALVAELRKQNLCDGPQVNIKEDPRVTRVGKILRTLQLDEFPQFVNVITGDMSIVGPRPSPDNENQYCPAWRETRLSVRPGITGLWQVMRTREAGKDFQEWIRFDIEYVEKMGPLFDAWICMATAVNLIRRRA